MKLTNYFLNFDFGGRARRSHYWANLGCWLLVLLAIVIPIGVMKVSPGTPFGMVLGLAAIAAVIAWTIDNTAVVFRRAHDTGRSGWIWLLLLVPLVNLLALYWLLIQDSDQGPNKYGPPVKAFYAAPAQSGA